MLQPVRWQRLVTTALLLSVVIVLAIVVSPAVVRYVDTALQPPLRVATVVRPQTHQIPVNGGNVILEQRLANVHNRCSELKHDAWKQPNWAGMLVNHERSVVMCIVAKTACTTWKRVLLRLTGKPAAVKLASSDRYTVHEQSGRYVSRLEPVNYARRVGYLMGHYYKVLFVREPLERLISGYRDKMFRASKYVGLRRQIKRMFRPNVSSSSKEFRQDVSFSEFVRYVLWESKHHAPVDHHWRPQYDVCRPCHIRYDYIGHYETMQDDAKHILQTVASGSDVKFPQGDFDSRLPNSNEYLRLFDGVSVADIRRLLEFYDKDYRVFGYEVPEAIRRRLAASHP